MAKFSEVTPGGYLNLQELTTPGRYTLVMVSTKACAPCDVLWGQLPERMASYDNVNVVRVRLGADSPHGVPSPQEDLSMELLGVSGVPAIVAVGPLGQTVAVRSGYDDSIALVEALEGRSVTEALPPGRPVPL